MYLPDSISAHFARPQVVLGWISARSLHNYGGVWSHWSPQGNDLWILGPDHHHHCHLTNSQHVNLWSLLHSPPSYDDNLASDSSDMSISDREISCLHVHCPSYLISVSYLTGFNPNFQWETCWQTPGQAGLFDSWVQTSPHHQPIKTNSR